MRPSAPYGHLKLVTLGEWRRLCVTREPAVTRLTHLANLPAEGVKSRREIEEHKRETEQLIATRPDDEDFARWEGSLFTLEWILGAKTE